ncbi:XRE family transcriptional regulator [Bacillus cereus]|nr:hypothetical protein II9_04876 [Bacillus cereus MSX-D12]PNU07763.1 XRE family transcriptional regulator [Bacillus cereus]
MNCVAEIRKKMGISQESLAKKARISRPYLSDIENHKKQPSVSTAIRIAKSLGSKVEDIFFDNL